MKTNLPSVKTKGGESAIIKTPHVSNNPTNSTKAIEWEVEFLRLTSHLIGERVTLDKELGSHFKAGQMYEIMEGITSFIRTLLCKEVGDKDEELYSEGIKEGIRQERERIIRWVKTTKYLGEREILIYLSDKTK
jgi:hypothetical protein